MINSKAPQEIVSGPEGILRGLFTKALRKTTTLRVVKLTHSIRSQSCFLIPS